MSRRTAAHVRCPRVGASFEQEAHGLDAAGPARPVKDGVAVRRRGADVGVKLRHQHVGRFRAEADPKGVVLHARHRPVQRRRPGPVAVVHRRRASLIKSVAARRVTVARGPVKARRTAPVTVERRRVAVVQEILQTLDVAVLGREEPAAAKRQHDGVALWRAHPLFPAEELPANVCERERRTKRSAASSEEGVVRGDGHERRRFELGHGLEEPGRVAHAEHVLREPQFWQQLRRHRRFQRRVRRRAVLEELQAPRRHQLAQGRRASQGEHDPPERGRKH
mmetsp:Transcript_19959/g.61742  ORF Transcript_19959/g.61742 Transcript_19959/m.61742 type:complete len:279 (-) Transcript_19959:11-847(-)